MIGLGSGLLPPDWQMFTNTNGTIAGNIDGTNALFAVGVPLRQIIVQRNGQFLTLGEDYSFGFRFVSFRGAQVPQPGDTLLFLGWPMP